MGHGDGRQQRARGGGGGAAQREGVRGRGLRGGVRHPRPVRADANERGCEARVPRHRVAAARRTQNGPGAAHQVHRRDGG